MLKSIDGMPDAYINLSMLEKAYFKVKVVGHETCDCYIIFRLRGGVLRGVFAQCHGVLNKFCITLLNSGDSLVYGKLIEVRTSRITLPEGYYGSIKLGSAGRLHVWRSKPQYAISIEW